MKFTGEKYIPELEGPEISYEHWHRYLFAKQFESGKVVLDIACGKGYGSYFLSTFAKKVIGINVSQETINYASSKYVRDNLEFRTGLASNIPIENAIFDVIISFETIEHIIEADQLVFLTEVKRLLKPSGFFFGLYTEQIDL
jgi:2-polyprenyl-3-methyl-5-hydroxy-6-metoxy-1,4-benzoquinol methylase